MFGSIAAARRWLNINPSRIFLAGYADGGTMALRMALAQPRLFAGVLSFGGGLPTTLRPLAQLHALRGLKIFLATGPNGRDVSRGAGLPRPAVAARGRHVGLPAVYPCGDELTTNMLSDMDRWIMEQVAPQPVLQGRDVAPPAPQVSSLRRRREC